jgi:hypothetical protein
MTMKNMREISGAIRKLFILGILFVCFMAESIFHSAWAINLRATPFISLAGGWDSNIDSSVDNNVSDVTYSVYPGIIISTDILETTISFSYGLNMQYYVDNPDRNTNGRGQVYGLNTAQPIHATENLTITPEARYFKSYDIYNRNSNVVGGSQDQVLSNQALAVTPTELTEFAGGLNLNYNISPVNSLYLNSIVVRDLYSTPGLIDSTIITSALGYGSQVSERTRIGPSINGNRSTFSNGEQSRIYTAALNIAYKLSEFDAITAAGGGSRWSTDGDPLATGPQKGWTPYASVSYQYDRETWHATMTATYQTRSSGGLLSVVNSYTGFASILKNITSQWSSSISSSYQKDINVGSSGNLDYSWFNQAILRYQIFENIGISLTGTQMFTNYDNINGVGSTVSRTNVFLGVDARKDYIIF